MRVNNSVAFVFDIHDAVLGNMRGCRTGGVDAPAVAPFDSQSFIRIRFRGSRPSMAALNEPTENKHSHPRPAIGASQTTPCPSKAEVPDAARSELRRERIRSGTCTCVPAGDALLDVSAQLGTGGGRHLEHDHRAAAHNAEEDVVWLSP
jgi:hypothetical protein